MISTIRRSLEHVLFERPETLGLPHGLLFVIED